MRNGFYSTAMITATLAGILAACGRHDSSPQAQPASGEKVVNLYTWTDYMAPDTISNFERTTGIKVHVSYFDTNEMLESKMLTGNSGFDVVLPVGPYFQREIRSGAYLPLNKRQLPNIKYLDPELMARVAVNDAGNVHGVIYNWGTFGIGYNRKMLAEALPGVALDSWRVLFDPKFAARLAKCGINFVDDPAGVARLVLSYLGRDPNQPSAQDLADVEEALLKVRPYVRNIDTSIYIEALANGDICIALGYNGDVVQARNRAKDAKNGVLIDYAVPEHGSLLWFTMLAIPRDAPNPVNAHVLINYLMDPVVTANISNHIGYASANTAATPMLDAALLSDPAVYPPLALQKELLTQTEDPPEQIRAITRLWQKFKIGR